MRPIVTRCSDILIVTQRAAAPGMAAAVGGMAVGGMARAEQPWRDQPWADQPWAEQSWAEQPWAANGRRGRWRLPACRQRPAGPNRAETARRNTGGEPRRRRKMAEQDGSRTAGSPGGTGWPEAGGSLAGRSPPSPDVTAACDPGTPAGDARPEPRLRSNVPVDNIVDSLGRTWGFSVDVCGKGL